MQINRKLVRMSTLLGNAATYEKQRKESGVL